MKVEIRKEEFVLVSELKRRNGVSTVLEVTIKKKVSKNRYRITWLKDFQILILKRIEMVMQT